MSLKIQLKTAKRLKKEGLISSYREGTEFFMLTQKSNNDCYLDSKNKALYGLFKSA